MIVETVASIIREETNVKSITFVEGSSSVVSRQAKPNFKALGKRLGRHMKAASQAIRAMSSEEIDQYLATGELNLDLDGEIVVLSGDDLEIVSEGIEGWLVGQENTVTVALDTAISDELRTEGLAREAINRIQNMRKDAGYDVTDRISVRYTGSQGMETALEQHGEWVRNETLSLEFESAANPDGELISEFDINTERLTVGIRLVSN